MIVLLSCGADSAAVLKDTTTLLERERVLAVVLSRWASRDLSEYKLSAAAKGTRIVKEEDLGGYGGIVSLLSKIGTVFVPDLDVPGASRIGSLAPVGPAERLVTEALITGKKVICSHSLFHNIAGDRTPPCAKEAITALQSKLAGLGVAILESGDEMSDPSRVAKAFDKCPSTEGECAACGLCVNLKPQAVERILSAGADRVSTSAGVAPPDTNMAGKIDHTLLKPDATEEEIRELCREAKQYEFATVCVNPAYVALAARELNGTSVGITTVVGFPLGATTPTAKAIETRDAVANGADEIDMVINVGALKTGNDDLVRRDIEAVVDAAGGSAGGGRVKVKVILETSLLSDEEKVRGSLLSKMAGADFVKTSTGFGPGGATVEDVKLMRETVGPEMGIKAAGGIRNRDAAKAMLEAGATRIGASASVAIVKGKG